MDKASASGAGDCGFESHQGRIFLLNFCIIIIEHNHVQLNFDNA